MDVLYYNILQYMGPTLAARANKFGGAAAKAEGDKRKKYAKNGINRRADNVKLFPLAFETFGRRGNATSAFFKMVAKRGEDLESCPKWAFYQRQVPKINAMLMLGNFERCWRYDVKSWRTLTTGTPVLRKELPEGGARRWTDINMHKYYISYYIYNIIILYILIY